MADTKKYLLDYYSNPCLSLYDPTLYSEEDQTYFEKHMVLELTDAEYYAWLILEEDYSNGKDYLDNLQKEYVKGLS